MPPSSSQLNNNQLPRTRAIILLVVGLALFGIGSYVVSYIRNRGKALITITVVPKDAEVKIGTSSVRGGRVYQKPGTYTLTATKNGFEKASSTITITDQLQPVKIRLIPTPLSPEAIKWSQANSDLYQSVEAEAGTETQQEGEDFEKKFPISSTLPYKNLLFSIDYSTNNTKNGFKIVITAGSAVDRKYALKQIQDWGYDPGDYQIEFSGFANPLETPR